MKPDIGCIYVLFSLNTCQRLRAYCEKKIVFGIWQGRMFSVLQLIMLLPANLSMHTGLIHAFFSFLS
jgi:hypothetical protein